MTKRALIYLLMLLVVGSSCSIEKRHHNKGFYISKSTKVKSQSAVAEVKEIDVSPAVLTQSVSVNEVEKNASDENIEEGIDTTSVEEIAVDNNKCDKIIFRDSREVDCVVKEISDTEIKYKKCDFEEGPLYTVDPSTVSAILYRNGTKEFYGNYIKPQESTTESGDYINGYTTWANDPREIEVFSVLSLVFSLLYFIPGLSIVFGIIGLRVFKKEPGKYKGKGFAYAGIVLGTLLLTLMILMILFF